MRKDGETSVPRWKRFSDQLLEFTVVSITFVRADGGRDRDSAKILLAQPTGCSFSSSPLSPLLPIFFLFFFFFFFLSSSSWCRSFYLANCIRSLKPSLRTDAQSLGLKEAGEAKIGKKREAQVEWRIEVWGDVG